MKTTLSEWGSFTYFDHDVIGECIASGQFWEGHLRPFLDDMSPGKVFVDAGANIGFFSIYCRQRGAEVHAFEACPEVCHLLRHNAIENHVTDIHIHEVALWDSVCEVALMPPHPGWDAPKLDDGRIDYEVCGNGGAFAVSPIGAYEERVYRMTAAPLDAFKIQNVSLLKTDVQGADLRVLKGARETILRCQPIIIFEFEGMPSTLLGDGLDSYFEYLGALNYRVDHIHQGDYVAVPLGGEKVDV